MSALIVKAASAFFVLDDGSKEIRSRGELVPAGVDKDQLKRYVELGAVGEPDAPAEVEADPKPKTDPKPKAEPVDVASLEGDALTAWFKGKKVDELQAAGLSAGQAEALLEVESAKVKPREAVVALLMELATSVESGDAGE